MNEHREDPTMEAAEIARLLGITRETFSRKKKSLISHEAMPAPLPGGRYSRKAIMHWIERYGARKTEEARSSIASLRVSLQRAHLEELYARPAA